jgi:hypothetical protein
MLLQDAAGTRQSRVPCPPFRRSRTAWIRAALAASDESLGFHRAGRVLNPIRTGRINFAPLILVFGLRSSGGPCGYSDLLLFR